MDTNIFLGGFVYGEGGDGITYWPIYGNDLRPHPCWLLLHALLDQSPRSGLLRVMHRGLVTLNHEIGGSSFDADQYLNKKGG